MQEISAAVLNMEEINLMLEKFLTMLSGCLSQQLGENIFCGHVLSLGV